jgi:hypothetical protein
MANYNGIEFNNVKQYGNFVSAGPLRIQGLDGTDLDDGTGIINAVEIDWNGAQVAGKTLNTIGEVLSN